MDKEPAADKTREIPNLVTEGHVWRSVWVLSWPTIISMFLQTAYGYINMYFVGHVGTDSVAAVGIGNSLLFVQFAVLSGIGVGTSALVARFVGARNLEEANEATRQSIVLAVIFTIATAIPGVLLAPYLLRILGAKGDVLPIAIWYLDISLIGGVPVFMLYVITTAFRALGDMKRPLYVMVVATVLNVLFDWLLVFGIWVFPKLGAPGTAISVIISRTVSLAMAYYYLSKSPLADSMHRWWVLHYGWFGRILRIGIPAALQRLLRSGNSVFYMLIFGATTLATVNIAALTIGVRAESLAFMPGFAFSMAATALVGQNLGARQPKRAGHAAWVATGQGMGVMTVVGILFFVLARPFAELFTRDPAVIRLVTWYLRINAVGEPFLGLGMIFTGALQGAGETRWPMAVTFFTLYLFRLPLTAWLMLSLNHSAVVAWWVMVASTVTGGLLTMLIFLRGGWQNVEV